MFIKQTIKNLINKSDFGLILDWEFHCKNKWASAYTPYLVNEIIRYFNPIIISNQSQYEIYKKKIRRILAFEPEWAAPRITYDLKIDCLKAVMYSDPHHQSENRKKYFEDNKFDYVLSLYNSPFFYHFKNFPKQKFVHFPWAVPDQFINNTEITVRNSEVAIYGGNDSDAYDVRNWCREQSCVSNYVYSGVENKILTDEKYYLWLRKFDAIVAAGSSQPIYNMVTPKYFEIASAGALLIGQYCEDLENLGFNETNSLIFCKDDFIEKVEEFILHPETFLAKRENGISLIKLKHKLSDRIKTLENIYYGV
jgi:hypothetical protein